MKALQDYNDRYPENKVRRLTERDIDVLKMNESLIPSNEDYVNALELYDYHLQGQSVSLELYHIITNAWVYSVPLPPVFFRKLTGELNLQYARQGKAPKEVEK